MVITQEIAVFQHSCSRDNHDCKQQRSHF